MKRLTAALLLAVTPAGLACTKENHPPTPSTEGTAPLQAKSSDLPETTAVATINGEKVTLKELDESVKGELDQVTEKFHKDRFRIREEGLEGLIFKKLSEAEAKKAGKTPEEWVKAQVELKAQPATEAEAKDFFEQNKERLGIPPGMDFSMIKDRLIQALSERKKGEVMAKLFDDLKASNKVSIDFEEPTKQVEAVGPSRGPADAPITIVEFSDFQCPFCSKVEPTVAQIMATYAGKVRFVFRDYPLPFHPLAQKASEAANCANDQGVEKYWAMHDAMFAHQDKLEVADLKETAKGLGLDMAKFNDCLDTSKMKTVVEKNAKAGSAVGVNGTPAFFVNGHELSGAQPFDAFKKIIDKELAKVAAK
jgi:protein-disulfide isomerase/predicted transcriptional regulator